MTHSGNGRQQTLVFHYLDTFPKPPFVPEWPTEIPDPTLEDIEKGLAERRGDGRHARRVRGRRAEVGRRRCRPADHGPVGHRCSRTSCSCETVTLFGDEVIPRFDKDPEHSTSRYRREAAARLGLA